jgi:hypothetical protein
MSDHPATPELGLTATLRAVALIGATLTLVGIAFANWRVGTEIAIGAVLGCTNLWLLGRVVSSTLNPGPAALPWSLVAVFKFTALIAVAYLLVRAGVAIVPLFVGLGAVPLGIVASSLRPAQPSRT